MSVLLEKLLQTPELGGGGLPPSPPPSPYAYGNKVIMMFGGLHIEMAALNSMGTLLHHSGWTSALVKEGIVSSGTAEAYLSALSVKRTRQAHQITACCLYKLRKSLYDRYSRDASQSSGDVLNEDSRAPPVCGLDSYSCYGASHSNTHSFIQRSRLFGIVRRYQTLSNSSSQTATSTTHDGFQFTLET